MKYVTLVYRSELGLHHKEFLTLEEAFREAVSRSYGQVVYEVTKRHQVQQVETSVTTTTDL